MSKSSLAGLSIVSVAGLTVALAVALSTVAATPGCSTSDGGRKCKLTPNLDPSVCALAESFSTSITNPYFPLPVGRLLVLEGFEGDEFIRLEIRVTSDLVVVGNVTTVVVTETEYVEGQLIEISWNYYAQASDGTVCYFGEAVHIYENNGIVSHAGAWRADEPGNAPGIFMPANPQVGNVYQQEYAPDIAEDLAEIVASGETLSVPYDTFTNTLTSDECTPLEKGPYGTKVYVSGIGIAYDNGAALISVQ